MTKVVKFGGTSLAEAALWETVFAGCGKGSGFSIGP